MKERFYVPLDWGLLFHNVTKVNSSFFEFSLKSLVYGFFLIYSQRHTASTWYPLDVPCWQLSTLCSRKSSGFWTGCSKCLWQPFLGFSRATPLLAGERRRLPPQASIFSYKQNAVGLYFSLLHRSGRARPSSSKWRVGRVRYMGAQGMPLTCL